MKDVRQRAVELWGKARQYATPRLIRAVALAVIGVLFVGFFAYAAGSQSQEATIDRARAAASEANARADRLEEQRDDAVEDLSDARYEHRVALTALREEQAQKEAELAEREASLVTREEAVSTAETVQASREFSGGMVIVGEQVEAGTYRSGGVGSLGMCYWEWLSSTASDASIVDNGLTDEGTTTVTLRDGDIFTSQSCGTWTKTD